MGVLHRLTMVTVAAAAATVYFAPVNLLRDLTYVCRPLNGCFPSTYTSPWPEPCEKVTQDSFAVELRDAYKPIADGGRPVWILMYTDIMDEDSQTFLPVWYKFAHEKKAEGSQVQVARLDRMRMAAVGWARAFDFKSYNAYPFLFLMREGRWYASANLGGGKLLKATANETTEAFKFFEEEGWEHAHSGKLPPGPTDDEVARAEVIKFVVRAIDLARTYWKESCAALGAVAFVAYMPLLMGSGAAKKKKA